MSKKVLLCDDEVHILRAAEFKLRRAGFDVECAGDGEEAWEAIVRQKPDVLVTDCQMPRLDGVGLIERLRSHQQYVDLPVLMLTAKGFELASQELTDKWNVLAVVSKPFSPRQLLNFVQQVVENGVIESPLGT